MAEKYYIRPRKVEDPKKWLGPFDISQLKDHADRRLFSKELHEYSEDRVNWISARQIWPTLFPKNTKTIALPAQPAVAVAQVAQTAQDTRSKVEQATPVQEMAEWYCACDGVQHGPFTNQQLRELAERGQLQPTDLIWCPTLGDQWVEAQSDPSLFPSASPDDLQIVDDAEPTKRSRNAPPLAIASFVLGLLGTACLPVLGSILAIIFGHVCLARMNRTQGPKNGKWMAIAGISIGYAMLAILMIATVVLLILFPPFSP